MGLVHSIKPHSCLLELQSEAKADGHAHRDPSGAAGEGMRHPVNVIVMALMCIIGTAFVGSLVYALIYS
jgi:hypothetical protein